MKMALSSNGARASPWSLPAELGGLVGRTHKQTTRLRPLFVPGPLDDSQDSSQANENFVVRV